MRFFKRPFYKFHFNPHSREGSDGGMVLLRELGTYFNPHSREGSDDIQAAVYQEVVNFNPHSREGSDAKAILPDVIIMISIHTPAKGVTRVLVLFPTRNSISIHTPAKGVTLLRSKSVSQRANFNPHSREGSDERV